MVGNWNRQRYFVVLLPANSSWIKRNYHEHRREVFRSVPLCLLLLSLGSIFQSSKWVSKTVCFLINVIVSFCSIQLPSWMLHDSLSYTQTWKRQLRLIKCNLHRFQAMLSNKSYVTTNAECNAHNISSHCLDLQFILVINQLDAQKFLFYI